MVALDYITIVLCTLGILIAGITFSKAGQSIKSFFAAGGNVPWWIGGLSLFMGFFSAGTFVVWGSIAYSYGLVAITIQACMCIAGFIIALLIAPRWKRTRVLTAAEYITSRLGVNVQKTYTYLFLFISMFTTGSFLYPVAKILEVSSGLPLYSAILLLGGISILYVTVGGLRAVVVTDVLQFVILTAAVLIVIPLSFDKVGGVSNFIDNVPDGFFKVFNGEYTLFFIIAYILYNAVFLGGNWSYVQRYTTVATQKDARKLGLLFGSLYVISPILWMLPPMLYRVYSPDLSGLADEGAYLLMCKEALPKGLLGMMIGGMIFATASSLNGTLNISAGVFTNDIFCRLKPNASNKTIMRVARLSTIGFGLLAVIVALLVPHMGGIVNVVISLGALTGVPLYLPVIWTLFSRRINSKAVMATTLISLGVNAVFKFVTPALFDFALSRTEEMVLGVSLPTIMLILFELWYRHTGYIDPRAAECEQAIMNREKQQQASSPENIDEVKNNRYSIKVIGIGILSAGLMVATLGIIDTGFKPGVTIIVGAILVILGGFIILKAKK
ncbi:sodium:solute symporter family protein [Gallalistipes aquisgranensis]|uniref:sodium:solute symporter family protein n=1 Tax=Gallalistipes aquisgranensis TaxID=2779358 RepID=UPI001CF8F1F6|nr:sodium:solute symporter family protein [Gallalistipes aquisgranensis]MBE5032780.1 Na+:solute symporter [Gallalistipes aquisgranensis]